MTDEEKLAKEKAEEVAKVAADEAKRKEEEEKNKNKTLTIEEHQKAINEVVAEREKLKEKFRDTRDKLSSLEKRLEGVPSGEDLKKILNEKKELEDYKKKIEQESEAKRLAEASEIEKLQIQLDKIKSAYETSLASKDDEIKKTSSQLREELEKKSKETERLLQYRKESEILKAAEKVHAVKPSQIVDMLSHKFVYDEELSEFVFPVYNAKGKRECEKTVDVYIKEFLEDPENDNLVKAEVKSGSGHYSSTTTTTTSKISDAHKFMRSEKAILEEEAEERGLKVEDWIAIKKIQEERKAKK
jgi:protein involved in ribonucleotide reduction